ncbi:hypothetical protein WJX72_000069 [[Myrmecia] bisecta]|uniref:Nucleoside diphosphate kinase-like domain-containing protein n=1 Tax=[Myrmecia] bisecta TaxID=41462 RepID=A0AAW1Q9Y8_9CHLO
MQLIELAGFTIVAQQKLQLTAQRAGEFYAEHKGKPFYSGLISFMTSGPIYALVLAKEDAIRSWRSLMGPTNVFVARAEQPKSLRALYGTDGTQNATHGSDSPASARREIGFFFPKLMLDPLATSEQAQRYLEDKLQPTLLKGLTALAKQKPSADKQEALAFLANWLLNNNPNKPRMVAPEDLPLNPADEDDEAEFAAAGYGRQRRTSSAARSARGDPRASASGDPMQSTLRDVISVGVAERLEPEEPTMSYDEFSDEEPGRAAEPASEHEAQEADQQSEGGVHEALEASDDDHAEAAIKVQAAYRGHKARADVKKTAAKERAAATKIQAGLRGMKARHEVADMRAHPDQ